MGKVLIYIFFTQIYLIPGLFGETYNITIPAYKYNDNHFEINDFGFLTDSANSHLPCKLLLFAIPPGSKVTSCRIEGLPIPITDSVFIESTLPQLLERSGNPDTKESGKEGYENKGQETASPSAIARDFGKYLGTMNFRNYTLAKVIISPFSYKKMKLFHTSNIRVELDYSSLGQGNSAPTSDTVFNSILSNQIFNFESVQKWYQKSELSYDYVIVVPNTLESVVKDFALWKQALGYKVKILPPFRASEIEKLLPKYLLVIGDSVEEIPGVISGRIPYTDSALVRSILDNTIQFEINNGTKRIGIIKGISNYANENLSGLPQEDKSMLRQELENVILTKSNWIYEEPQGTDIMGDYSIINFSSVGKKWLQDNMNNIPEPDEIETSDFNIYSSIPYLVFAPFPAIDFLKQEAVCIVSPEQFSTYTVGWRDSCDGGSQSFNYVFLKMLAENEVVGDAFLKAKLWYMIHFPQDSLNINTFQIWGDPSLCLIKRAGVDVGITGTNVKWLPEDTTARGATSISPDCWVSNFGFKPVFNCNIYCTIDSNGIPVYNNCIAINLESMERKRVVFPRWSAKGYGIPFMFEFKSFLPYDEKTENDNLSVITYIAGGNYLVFTRDSVNMIDSLLRSLNYNGVKTNEISSLSFYFNNFNSLFICSLPTEQAGSPASIDSFFQEGRNIYIEGNNLWLNKFLKGRVTKSPIATYISGKGASLICSDSINREWFIPDGAVPIFTDSTGEIAGFCYDNGYKIWCNRFQLSEIKEFVGSSPVSFRRACLLDSVMHFFGLFSGIEDTTAQNLQRFKIQSIYSTPNPFYNRTSIKFIVNETLPIEISVYNLTGKLVKNLSKETVLPGEHQVEWDASDNEKKPVVNGIYFLKIQTNQEKHLFKLIVLK